MSLRTTCPSCKKVYALKPEQLKVSQGWVRCGNCKQAFDAALDLHVLFDESPPAIGPRLDVAKPTPEPPKAAVQLTSPWALSVAAVGNDAAQQVATTQASLSVPISPPEPVQVPVPAPAHMPPQAQTTPAFVPAGRSEPTDAWSWNDEEKPASALFPEEISAYFKRKETHSDAALPNDLASPFQASRQAPFHQRPSLWVLLCVGAFFILTLQYVVHQRARLAAHHPDWRPALQTLCNVFACAMPAYADPDAVAIEHSSFSKVAENIYQIQIQVRNRSEAEVAMPSLELSLTNLRGEVVIRRVISPSLLGIRQQTLAARGEITGKALLSLTDMKLLDGMQGYRVVVFYP